MHMAIAHNPPSLFTSRHLPQRYFLRIMRCPWVRQYRPRTAHLLPCGPRISTTRRCRHMPRLPGACPWATSQ